MGANISGTYAGIRPERVSQLILLDFLGLKPAIDDDSPTLIGKWLQNLDNGPPQAIFQNSQALAKRLMELNPRLTEARAEFLSWTVSRNRSDGMIEMACDPWHRVPSPMVYRAEDAMACWRKIEAPVLLLIAQYGLVNQRFGNDRPEFDKRIGSFRNLQTIDIPDSGHNVQHDQPELVAAAIERFLTRD